MTGARLDLRCGLAWLAGGLAVAGLCGCGGQAAHMPSASAFPPAGDRSTQARIARLRPVATGRGTAFRLPPRGSRARRGLPIGSARCEREDGHTVQAHLELFARGHVVPIPPGIGISPPLARRGAYVLGGRCSYPVRAREPTGLLELRAGARISLGELFEIWGQPLSRQRMAGFRGSTEAPVRAYLGGVRWRGDPRAIPLRRHAVIVLELGPHVAPHARYLFPSA